MQLDYWPLPESEKVFQSMHPLKDATGYVSAGTGEWLISIHAPYKGCNACVVMAYNISN